MTSHSDKVNTVPKQSREKPDTQQKAERLLKFLRSQREDRGVMADLRCALVDGKRHRAWPYLGYLGGIGDQPSKRAIQTIAGLYATHPEETQEGDFGGMCRKLLGEEERSKPRCRTGPEVALDDTGSRVVRIPGHQANTSPEVTR